MRWGLLGLLCLIIAILLIVVPVTAVQAESSDGVTVIAVGWICGSPGNFTLTYISDHEIGISWVKGEDAENTLIRASYGRAPQSRLEGYLVYYGAGTYCSDTGVSLDETIVPVIYRAWSQRADGIWAEDYAEGNIGGESMALIAQYVFIIGLAGLAMWQKHIILYIGAFIGILLVGLDIAQTSWATGIPTLALAGYMMYKAVRVYI